MSANAHLATVHAEGAVSLPLGVEPTLMELALVTPTVTTLTIGVWIMSLKAKFAIVAVVVLMLLGSIGW